ncbi:hypothetical protein G6F64_015339 [Rhizopus arrhizus]|uniref:Uncharacterized protein n=1 Tax=Rhizopus oryzae TaxID=64495 RepID=A0A9P6WRQ5_RHIOR|nr:hypothetical protein G6F64_015339 [Rhizopus arrhizus]
MRAGNRFRPYLPGQRDAAPMRGGLRPGTAAACRSCPESPAGSSGPLRGWPLCRLAQPARGWAWGWVPSDLAP